MVNPTDIAGSAQEEQVAVVTRSRKGGDMGVGEGGGGGGSNTVSSALETNALPQDRREGVQLNRKRPSLTTVVSGLILCSSHSQNNPVHIRNTRKTLSLSLSLSLSLCQNIIQLDSCPRSPLFHDPRALPLPSLSLSLCSSCPLCGCQANHEEESTARDYPCRRSSRRVCTQTLTVPCRCRQRVIPAPSSAAAWPKVWCAFNVKTSSSSSS